MNLSTHVVAVEANPTQPRRIEWRVFGLRRKGSMRRRTLEELGPKAMNQREVFVVR